MLYLNKYNCFKIMENVASILTITFPSFIAYEDWLKRTKEFFIKTISEIV